MIDAKETRNKYIEVMERDARLGICAIEEARERVYRERGSDYEKERKKKKKERKGNLIFESTNLSLLLSSAPPPTLSAEKKKKKEEWEQEKLEAEERKNPFIIVFSC